MSAKMIMFFGSKYDQDGMPDPFFNYQIYASDLGGKYGLSAIATIFSPTGGAVPAGGVHHIPLTEGTSQDAFDQARNWLVSHPLHVGLKRVG